MHVLVKINFNIFHIKYKIMNDFVSDEVTCKSAVGVQFASTTKKYEYFKNDLKAYELKKISIPDIKWFINSQHEFSYLPKPLDGEWLSVNKETGQTFKNYVRLANKKYKTLNKTQDHILLVPLVYEGHVVSDFILNGLSEFLEIFYDSTVKVGEKFDLHGRCTARDYNKYKQIDENRTLSIVKTLKTKNISCVAAITQCDIIDFRRQSFVFGITEPDLRVCVSSLARYNPSFYDEDDAEMTEQQKLLKACSVVSHEIGHVFGLEHCIYYRCVMNGSNSLDEDEKLPLHFCSVCLKKMHFLLNFNIENRYVRLMEFFKKYAYQVEYKWHKNIVDKFSEL